MHHEKAVLFNRWCISGFVLTHGEGAYLSPQAKLMGDSDDFIQAAWSIVYTDNRYTVLV